MFKLCVICLNMIFSAKMADPPQRGHPYVEMDVRRMEQVVQNLILNALKHTKPAKLALDCFIFIIVITIK
ncbi:MAG TPA: ATP-binding protein [Bacillus bacterium]|nr:ATP-binding protein [Bacillus sp. (in: firmicutes)]